MGKERELGAGCRSCSLQGLTTEVSGQAHSQCLMPSTGATVWEAAAPAHDPTEQRSSSGHLAPSLQGCSDSSATRPYSFKALASQLCCSLSQLDCYHPACPLHLGPLHFPGSIHNPSCIFTHIPLTSSPLPQLSTPRTTLGTLSSPGLPDLTISDLMAHPMSTSPDSLSYFIPLCPDTVNSLLITAP